jgi:long-chain acyl-CoA synthetase
MYPETHAAITPDKHAVIMAGSGRILTYRDLDDRSAGLAAGLYALGLRRGDVIALLSDNVPEAFEIFWAAMRSGLYIAAINRHLAPGEVAYILRDSGARVLFASAVLSELAQRVADEVPEVTERYAFGGNVTGYAPYTDLTSVRPPLTDQPLGSEMLYSSGYDGSAQGYRVAVAHASGRRPRRRCHRHAAAACVQAHR